MSQIAEYDERLEEAYPAILGIRLTWIAGALADVT